MKTIITLLSSCAVTAYAQTAPRPLDILEHAQQQNALQSNTKTANPSSQAVELSEQQLLAQPEFLQQLLDNAIDNQHINAIQVLLPIYAKSTIYDDILYQYGQATVAHSTGKISQAIDIYRKIIAQQPDLNPIRLKLANALIQDKQYTSAQAQLQKLASETDLPEQIRIDIAQQIAWLKQQDDWNVHTRVRYLDDKNVNQAPKISQYGGWTLPQAESAQGIGYYLAVDKTYAKADHLAMKSQISVDGKQYWNAHQYDDITAQFDTAVMHRTADHEWQLTPYVQQRWFAQEPYSQTIGLRNQYNRLFNAQWQGFSQIQYAQKTHKKRKHLDAKIAQISLSTRYAPTARQAWSIGIDSQYEHSQDQSERNQRQGVWLGWEQEWAYGLSSTLFTGVSKIQYKLEDIFQIKRKDHEYFAQASLWHRALHWKGLTPKLTTLWRKNQSNHFLYGYDKTQVFVELSKTF